MKLQIVEYRTHNMLEGNIHYRYMLELDEKIILWTPPTSKKKEPRKVYSIMREMLNKNIDYNMEHYVKLNEWPGVEREVIVEEEVSDAFLKELYIKQRIQDIEEDFK